MTMDETKAGHYLTTAGYIIDKIRFIPEGGSHENFDVECSYNLAIENFLSLGHMLNAVIGYKGIHDGLRDEWSGQFKNILFQSVKASEVDYQGFAEVIREKTKQPRQPTLP